jgi:predicted transcriptional regulator
MARSATAKQAALALIERLPPNSDWDDIMRELYVRRKIEAGITAADAGRVVSHDEVKRRFRPPR